MSTAIPAVGVRGISCSACQSRYSTTLLFRTQRHVAKGKLDALSDQRLSPIACACRPPACRLPRRPRTDSPPPSAAIVATHSVQVAVEAGAAVADRPLPVPVRRGGDLPRPHLPQSLLEFLAAGFFQHFVREQRLGRPGQIFADVEAVEDEGRLLAAELHLAATAHPRRPSETTTNFSAPGDFAWRIRISHRRCRSWRCRSWRGTAGCLGPTGLPRSSCSSRSPRRSPTPPPRGLRIFRCPAFRGAPRLETPVPSMPAR